MESKNHGRGVQQDDVWGAADSLIADGLRPTIERVRQKIGRGSPNTVSPMLEAWFATLADRLAVNKKEEKSGNIPTALEQALKDAWKIALSEAREKSALEIVQSQADLTQASQVLKEREIELVQIDQIRAVKLQALDDALQVARNNTEDARARLSKVQKLVSSREMEIQNLYSKMVTVEAERDAERHRNQESVANNIQERQKIEERFQVVQHKLLEEIDRARQETKKISIEAQANEKYYFAEKILFEKTIQSQEKDLANIQMRYIAQSSDVDALRQTAAVSVSRSNVLENLFKTQLADSHLTISRLTEALSIRVDRSSVTSKFTARKLKRPGVIRKG